MKSSGIGGQAVMEGIMMKNKDDYAVAVRKPDGEIVVDKQTYRSIVGNHKALTRIPFVRGVFNFIDSMIIGMKTLMFSASFLEDEEEKKPITKKRKLQCRSEKERKTGKCVDDWDSDRVNCICGCNFYGVTVLVVRSFETMDSLLWSSYCNRGSGANRHFYFVYTADFPHGRYSAYFYVPWCRAQVY